MVGSYCGTGTYWLSYFSSDCSWVTPASRPVGPEGMVAEGLKLFSATQGTLAACGSACGSVRYTATR